MLTQGEREYAIERAISHIKGRFVEQQIRAASDHDTAVRVARERCRYWGCASPGRPFVSGDGTGIKVRTRDGRQGMVTYTEIARYVQDGASKQVCFRRQHHEIPRQQQL